jgi:Na+-driven multidrug efflux pump
VAVDAAYDGALIGSQRTGAVLALGALSSGLRAPLAAWLMRRQLGVELAVWAAIAVSIALKAPATWLAFRFAKSDGRRTAQ